MNGGITNRTTLPGKLLSAKGTERNKEIIELDIIKLSEIELNKTGSRNRMNNNRFGLEENEKCHI